MAAFWILAPIILGVSMIGLSFYMELEERLSRLENLELKDKR